MSVHCFIIKITKRLFCNSRRLKQDVLDQLPSKVRQMVILDPGSVKIGREMKNSHKFVHKAKVSGMC